MFFTFQRTPSHDEGVIHLRSRSALEIVHEIRTRPPAPGCDVKDLGSAREREGRVFAAHDDNLRF